MASETRTDVRTGYGDSEWVAGGVGGLVAGVVMGILLQTMMTPVITTAIPALYGMNGLVVGWIAHLFHSVVFGLVFAALASTSALEPYATRLAAGVGLGIAYGVVIWIVAAAFVMPVWLSAVGFPGAPPLPNFNPMSLVGHAVFGLVLGGAYAILRGR